jgi:phosphatidate cytidylyltransferase
MKSRWTGLPRRIGTALGLAAGSLFMIWAGPKFFLLEILFLAMAGSAEFFDLVERKGFRPARRLGTLAIFGWLLADFSCSELVLSRLALGGFLLFLMLVLGRIAQRTSTLIDVAATWLGVGYVGWLFSFVLKIRQTEGVVPFHGLLLSQGAFLVTLLVLLCTATDTAAYFTGRLVGKHLLCPAISPGKTVEGALGGLLAAMAVGRWFTLAVGGSSMHGLALGAIISVAGQLGDMWESALKRDAGVKDSGDIIGGHGGVLDRFDSLAFAAPVFYLFGQLFNFF